MPDSVSMPGPDKFLSCDWGTSSFRLRLVALAGNPADGPSSSGPSSSIPSSDLSILAECKNSQGIAATFELWKTSGEERVSFYQSFLEAQIKELQPSPDFPLRDIPLIISGMASSSIGMKELPYAKLPFDTEGKGLYWETFEATPEYPRRTLLVSGVRSSDDVMRGEETQLIGCPSIRQQEQIFIFPGTHSKHVRVKEGKVVDFKTYMTGEFFGLLSKYSILSGSIAVGETPATSRELTAGAVPMTSPALPGNSFEQGVADSRQTNLLHQSFLVRTRQLLAKMPKEENYHYLSGLLIGHECKELAGTSTRVTLVSDEPLQTHYARALQILGITGIERLSLHQAVINGQAKIARSMGK